MKNISSFMHALFTHISHKIMMYKYFLYWYTFLYFKLILLFTWNNFFNELEIFTCIHPHFFFNFDTYLSNIEK